MSSDVRIIVTKSHHRLPENPVNQEIIERLMEQGVSAHSYLAPKELLLPDNDEAAALSELVKKLPPGVYERAFPKILSPRPNRLKRELNGKAIEWLRNKGFDASSFFAPESELPPTNNPQAALDDLRALLPPDVAKHINAKLKDSKSGGGSATTKPIDDDDENDGGMGTTMGGPSMGPPGEDSGKGARLKTPPNIDSGKGARSLPEPEHEEGVDVDM